MNAAQRNRQAALVRVSGYEDCPALTVQSTDGEIPHGRELSFSWLAGTVMTGLTSVLLMGAALYVAFLGQDTFSTPYEALTIETRAPVTAAMVGRTDRIKPIALTRSEREVVEASIREDVDGVSHIRRQPFVRVRATLATTATVLSDDIPTYDPAALLNRIQPMSVADGDDAANTAIYGAEVEGEITVRTAALPLDVTPSRAVTDQGAADFIRGTMEGFVAGPGIEAMAYAPFDQTIIELGQDILGRSAIAGTAENVTVIPKTTLPTEATAGRTERIVTLRESAALEDALTRNGFTSAMIEAIGRTLRNVYPSTNLPAGARLRILFGPDAGSETLIPYRMSIYVQDNHAATVALTDRGQYVLGLAPPDMEFPDEDIEEINVNNLPTIYRSIWETGRKHDLSDETIDRIILMFAYDLDLTRRIAPGDAIEILQAADEDGAAADLLYVALTVSGTTREFFRFMTEDGEIDFYDVNGESGKRFLNRRPLEGGGTLRSRFGGRNHPIFGGYRMHTGIDLSARTGTPIYAAGDGVVDMAQWYSGYGRYVRLNHVNGYQTAYAHMNQIASGINPGTRVRQGQVIGYVGSTGQSTGPHLHFEILINGNHVDPLSVRLPRANTLPAHNQREFAQIVDQIRELMQREPTQPALEPVTVASAG